MTLLNPAIGVFTGDSELRVHGFGTQIRHRCALDVPRSCRHPSFGQEPYGVCRNFSFGTELYRDCGLMTEEEVVA